MPVTQTHSFRKSNKGKTNQAKSKHLSIDLEPARPEFRYQLCHLLTYDLTFLEILFLVYKMGM